MAYAHLILQAKGGSGKSTSAFFLISYLLSLGKKVIAIDLDPANNTLAGFKEFGVKVINIMSGDNIDARVFDEFMEIIISADPDTHIVVDNGASSFIAMMSYLKETEAIQFLKDNGHDVFIHTVITGGNATLDTVSGLDSLCRYFGDTKICIWLNYYFGEIVYKKKPFEDFEIYKNNIDKFHAVIHIPLKNASTYGKDIEAMLARRETFDAAINSSLPIMERQRIKTYFRALIDAINASNFLQV